jgi:prevent-host-death family protein
MEIGTYEAKTRFSELLEKVAQGERIVITKHGHPIALLSPTGPKVKTAAEAIENIRRLRKGIKSKGIRIKDLIQEGRR